MIGDHRRSNLVVRVFFLLLILALGFSSGPAAQGLTALRSWTC